MTYQQLKQERQAKYTALFDSVGLFWAFGREQFEEGKKKNPVTDGHKYISIGAGGFFPGQNKQAYLDGMDEIRAWEKEANRAIKESREETEKAIAYELNNYECFYTASIEPVVELFEGTYTRKQIQQVYRKYVNKPVGPRDKILEAQA